MYINLDKVPSTIDEAIDELFRGLDEADIAHIKEHSASSSHFGFGMKMRNSWSMWDQETPLVQDFKNRFNLFGHGDDVYGVIAAGLWARVKGKDPAQAMEAEAESYRVHWRKAGLDPVTGKRI